MVSILRASWKIKQPVIPLTSSRWWGSATKVKWDLRFLPGILGSIIPLYALFHEWPNLNVTSPQWTSPSSFPTCPNTGVLITVNSGCPHDEGLNDHAVAESQATWQEGRKAEAMKLGNRPKDLTHRSQMVDLRQYTKTMVWIFLFFFFLSFFFWHSLLLWNKRWDATCGREACWTMGNMTAHRPRSADICPVNECCRFLPDMTLNYLVNRTRKKPPEVRFLCV